MKKIYIVFLVLLSATAFKLQAQVKVVGAIQPNNKVTDTYPTHYDIYGNGGFRSVDLLTDRDNITPLRRKEGMLVYVAETKLFYQLLNTDPLSINTTIDNTKWASITLGGSSISGGGIISGTGDPVTTPPVNPQDGSYYLDTSTNILYGPYNSTTNTWPQVGAGAIGAGATGATGPTGPAGSQILSGSGDPTNFPPANPQNGDYYFDTAGKTLYGPYNSTTNSWPATGTSLTGGAQGVPGSQIISGTGPATITPANPATPKNGDYYFDTIGKLLYGPYNANIPSWPAGVDLTGGGQGPTGANGASVDFKGTFADQAAYDVAFPAPVLNQAYYNTALAESRIFTSTGWTTLVKDGTGGSGGGSGIFDAHLPSTRPNLNGDILGTTTSTINEVLQALIYPSVAAGASLDINGLQSSAFEIGSSLGSYNLNWKAIKVASTQPFKSVTVNGSLQNISGQTAGPSSLTGSIPVTPAASGATSYSMSVVTQDNKTTNASASISFLPKRYWGRSVGSVPTGTEIVAAAGGGSELTSSQAKSDISFNVSASGANHIYFAYPTSLPQLTLLNVGGFGSLNAFTLSQVSVTNASGFTQMYNVYTSNNTFTAGSGQIVTQ